MPKKSKAEIEAELAAAAAAAEAEAKAKAEAEERERLRLEEEARQRAEAERQRRTAEIERITGVQAATASHEAAKLQQLLQLLAKRGAADEWRRYSLASLALDTTSTAKVETFVTNATDDCEAALEACDRGMGFRDGLLPSSGRPFSRAMGTVSVLTSAAMLLHRQATRMAEVLENTSSRLAQATVLFGLGMRRLDATTAAFLDAVQAGQSGYGEGEGHVYMLKEGVRELWTYDQAQLSETAVEGMQAGIDSSRRRSAGSGVGMLRDRAGVEMLLWSNLPPGRAGRARIISTVAFPNGQAVPVKDGRTEVTIELHKAIVNSPVVLRVMKSEVDIAPSAAVAGLGDTGLPGHGHSEESYQARMTNDGKGKIIGKRPVSSTRPSSGRSESGKERPDSAVSRPGSRPPSAKEDKGGAESKASEQAADGKEVDTVDTAATGVTDEVTVEPVRPVTPLDPSKAWRGLGGVLSLELLAMPPVGTQARQWTLLPLTGKVPDPHTVRRLPHPLSAQGPSAMQSQAVRVKVRLPTDVILPPEPITVAAWHDGVEGAGVWKANDITEVSLDRTSRLLSFSTIYFTAHTLVVPRQLDLPYAQWLLQPAPVPAEWAHQVQELLASAQGPVKASPQSLLLTVRGPRFDVTIRVLDLGCVLEGPVLPELAHVVGRLLQPGELLRLLHIAGIVLQPQPSDVPYINRSEVKPGRGTVRLLQDSVEDLLLGAVASVAGGYELRSSAWNSDPSMHEGMAVFLAREYNPLSSPAVQAECTAWRTVAAFEDKEVPTGLRYTLVQDREDAAAARWTRRVRAADELAKAQEAENKRVSDENAKRAESARQAQEAADAAAQLATEAAGEGAAPVAAAQIPAMERLSAATLTAANLPAVPEWRGEPEAGDAGLGHGVLSACLAGRASPAARAAQANTSPLLVEVAHRLLRLIRPLSFTS